MKRSFFIFALLVIGLTAFAKGVCIDGLYYELNKNNMTAKVVEKSFAINNFGMFINKNWDIEKAIIPEYVNYKDNTYRVTTIGATAFANCFKLTSVVIPNSVTGTEALYMQGRIVGSFANCHNLTSVTLGDNVQGFANYTFMFCKALTSINIPNSVTKIGQMAFAFCSGLTSITIPNSVKCIDKNAFSGCTGLTSAFICSEDIQFVDYVFDGCPNVTIYTSSDAAFAELKPSQVVRVAPEQIIFYMPFSDFVKEYVEEGINEWQKKEEFERVAEWQKRVNEQSRQEKIQALLSEAQDKYLTFHAENAKVNFALGNYDAENEVFAMSDERYGTVYVAVPFEEAKEFKTNWETKTISSQLQILDDEIKLASLTIDMPNGKQYTYRNTDAVNYNMAEVEYHFDPIELNIPKTATAPQQGQQNITKTTLKITKSAVDTDIPQTNASNPHTFAVIFANEDYKNVASVPFAKNDGVVFQQYCQKTLGIPASNIHYVENASYNDIRIQLAWLKDVCDAYEGNASVIVYYAGHGIPDESTKSAYLLPVDGDGRYVQSAYKIDDFYNKLGTMNAKSVTVFMDACFSGSAREDKMLASARGVAIKAKSGEPQGNMVVFSAAQGDETAYPNNDEQHGIFTYYLLKKLQETKGDVTLQDLGNYITTNVRQQSIVKNGKPQTPCVTPSASLGTSWQTWTLK